jgi:hypothetical protein
MRAAQLDLRPFAGLQVAGNWIFLDLAPPDRWYFQGKQEFRLSQWLSWID